MSVLSQLGRRNYVSESRLASLLTELKELGQLPEQTSRAAIKRARDQAISDLSAQYGTLMKTKKIPLEGGEGELSVCFLDPVATLVTCLEQCVPFRGYMSSCLEKLQGTTNLGESLCTRTRSVRGTSCATSTSERPRRSTGHLFSLEMLAFPPNTCGLPFAV